MALPAMNTAMVITMFFLSYIGLSGAFVTHYEKTVSARFPVYQKPVPIDYAPIPEPLTRLRKYNVRDVSEVTVEVICVVDTEFVNTIQFDGSIDDYLSIFWNDVNFRFSSISSPKINVHLVGVVYLDPADESKIFIYDAGSTVNYEKTLTKFGEWVLENGGLFPSDFAYLLTSRDLTSTVAGFAYSSAVCSSDGKQSYSVGIGEDRGSFFEGTGLAVHEIGHNLGSPHDGESSTKKCSDSKGNVMTPAPDFMGNSNSLYFSQCSINNMLNYFQSDAAKCLTEIGSYKSEFPTTEELPGEIHAVLNNWCEKYVTGMPESNSVPQAGCKQIVCATPGYDDISKDMVLPDGAPCSSGKCLFAQCK